MGALPMPGDWFMSAMWLPMCGQTWLDAAATFTGNWALMMTPMMLPALYRALRAHWTRARLVGDERPASSTLWIGVGYCLAWTAAGTMAFAVGAALAANIMRSSALARAMPVCAGIVIAFAGFVQCSAWKARRIAYCRATPRHTAAGAFDLRRALGHGLRLALHEGYGCANLMGALFALGAMDLYAMFAITVAMVLEHWAPLGGRTFKCIGFILIAIGAFLISRAMRHITT